MQGNYSWYVKMPSAVFFTIFIISIMMSTKIALGTALVIFLINLWLFLYVSLLRKVVISTKNTGYWIFLFTVIYVVVYAVFYDSYFKQSLAINAIPFHGFAGVCQIYTFFYVSKLLIFAEEKKNMGIDRYIGTFLLLWFVPIGIWFIHPRVRKVVLAGT